MKKYWRIIALVATVALVSSYMAFGQKQKSRMMAAKSKKPDTKQDVSVKARDNMVHVAIDGQPVLKMNIDEWGGSDKPAARMCKMHKMMGKAMTQPHMVSTSDGGVVVRMGDKLLKYSAQLDLVAETKLKMDMQSMEQKMKKMMESCPMCKKMMRRSAQKSKASSSTAK